MSDVTLWLNEDEFWPWRDIKDEPQENLKRYYTAVTVDKKTAARWRKGLAAAYALQEEIDEAWDRAKANASEEDA